MDEDELLELIAYHTRRRTGMEPDRAQRLAAHLVDEICAHFNGQSVYFPDLSEMRGRKERNRAIKEARSAGLNTAELSDRFGLSRRRIRQILAV